MKKLSIVFLAILFLYSCDLFRTRDVETPVTQGSTFIPPTIPENVFTNMKNSLADKVIENYMACFVDSAFLKHGFTYSPAAGAVSKFNTLNSWDLQSERQYINNVFSVVQNGEINLTLTNEDKTPQGDSAIYFYDYTLVLPTDNPEIPDTYKGSVRFTLNIDARNNWVITRWIDIQSGDNPSWSELRGRFY